MANKDSEEKAPKKKVRWSVAWEEARRLLWARRRRLILGFVLLIISRLAGMVVPAMTRTLIDQVIGEGQTELLPKIAIAGVLATTIQAITAFALAILLGVAGQRSINDLRLRVQQHISRLPVRYFEENKSGELISRIMSDAEGIRNLIGTGFVQLLGGLLTSVVAFGVLVWLNWRLTLIALVLLVVFAAMMATGFSRIRPIFRERNKLMADVTGRLSETLGGVRVVKAYTAEKRESRLFAHGAHKLLRQVAKSMVWVSGITASSSLIFGLAGIAMSVSGALEVTAGRMTVGDLFMFVIFTGLLVTPLIQMSSIGTQFTEAFAGLDRLNEVFSEVPEDADDAERTEIPRIEGRVVFEDVGFEYEENVPVLRDISFEAAAGTTTALVGRSGAGKSTLIHLALAFRRPQKGRVLVDGYDLATVRLRSYREQLAVVLQDDFLFDGTIAENIAYGKPRASESEIEAAGRLAKCDEFVEGFTEGYGTIIGERGVKLSGGQRQRVTIARAILADPRILILDEATSSLDSENEAAIQDGLNALQQGRTTFVIAHRLSTIRNADQILVLEDGQIIEKGTHSELIELAGRYKDLYDRQYHFERNRFINPGEEHEGGDYA